MTAISGRVTFGAFELDMESGKLCKNGRVLRLRPQPMRVLCLLVSQAGKPVSRNEIRGLLWDESTFDWLEAAYRLRDGYLFWLPGAPGFDPLYSDARFADLIHRLGVVPRELA